MDFSTIATYSNNVLLMHQYFSYVSMVRYLQLALTGENESTVTIRTPGSNIVRTSINMYVLYACIYMYIYICIYIYKYVYVYIYIYNK